MSKTSDDALLDLRPLPHALGPEKSVLSSLLSTVLIGVAASALLRQLRV